MKTLLIITNRTLHTAPRVIRALEALSDHFHIHTVGQTAPVRAVSSHTHAKVIGNSLAAKVFNKLQRDLLKKYIPFTHIYPLKKHRLERLIRKIQPDIVMCHEYIDLPYLAELKKSYGFKLVFNAHEYYPLEFDELPDWASTWQRYYENLYSLYLPAVDLFINVCESIREKCLETFGKDSLVIPNAAFFSDMPPVPVHTPVRMIHHGGANPGRKIEEMIRLVDLLGAGYDLTLMLMPNDKAYLRDLMEQNKNKANIHFIEPVPFRDIVPTLNQYDIGLYILPPSSYNNAIALPNKIFEFIQAKLCIAIGPSPEMSRLVTAYDLGVIAEDFSADALAVEIGKLSAEDIFRFKQKAIFAAGEVSAEKYNRVLLDHFQQL